MQDQKEASKDINWIAVIKISEAIVVIAGTYITTISKKEILEARIRKRGVKV